MVITPTDCQKKDYLSFYRPESKWFTYDLKNSKEKMGQFHYSKTTHSFFGKTLSEIQKVSVCEMINHQKGREVTIETKFTLEDVLMGFIPGHSPRTITINGLYILEEMD